MEIYLVCWNKSYFSPTVSSQSYEVICAYDDFCAAQAECEKRCQEVIANKIDVLVHIGKTTGKYTEEQALKYVQIFMDCPEKPYFVQVTKLNCT